MSTGLVRNLIFSDGVTVSAPTYGVGSVTGQLSTFVDDAAYVTAKGSAAADGDIYYNTTSDLVRYYSNGAWSSLVDDDSSQTVTNKTIVAASNTITTAASGNLTSTELDAALAELQGDIDTRATSTELSDHEIDTSTHGVGEIVGTTETQTLTDKTLTNLFMGETVDSTTTGANQAIAPTTLVYKVTNASLTSIQEATPTDNNLLFLINEKGTSLSVINNAGTVGSRIITGTGADFSLANNATAILAYEVDSGVWRLIGGAGGSAGGMAIDAVDHTIASSTLSSNVHYVIDMSGASGNISVEAPAGDAGATVFISAIGNSSNEYRVTVTGNGSETFTYDGVTDTSIQLVNLESWMQIIWDDNDTTWRVIDASTAYNGNFVGDLGITGTLSVDTINEVTSGNGVQIQGRTDGSAIASGYVGEKIDGAWQSPAIGAAGAVSTLFTIDLTPGNWLINCAISITTGASVVWPANDYVSCGISTISGTLQNIINASNGLSTAAKRSVLNNRYISVSANTTIYIQGAHGMTTTTGASYDSSATYTWAYALRIG